MLLAVVVVALVVMVKALEPWVQAVVMAEMADKV
jgi:hypothetical protein